MIAVVVIKALLALVGVALIGVWGATHVMNAAIPYPSPQAETRGANRAGVAGAVILAALLLAGCATTPPPVREVTVTKEVPMPYHQPCPAPDDKPVVPKRVAEEHPAMPKDAAGGVDWQAVSRILGAKVAELFGYAAEADGVMTECGKQRGNAPR